MNLLIYFSSEDEALLLVSVNKIWTISDQYWKWPLLCVKQITQLKKYYNVIAILLILHHVIFFIISYHITQPSVIIISLAQILWIMISSRLVTSNWKTDVQSNTLPKIHLQQATNVCSLRFTKRWHLATVSAIRLLSCRRLPGTTSFTDYLMFSRRALSRELMAGSMTVWLWM